MEIAALAVVMAKLHPELAAEEDFAQRAIASTCERRGIEVAAFESAVDEISADEERAERLRQRISARVGELLAADVQVAPPQVPRRELRERAGATER